MSNLYILFMSLALFLSSLCERRIKNGHKTDDKRYAVYFLKAHTNSVQYRGWTCGGAIVTRYFVVTSAACLEDVQHMYVIAGYKKFVSSANVDEDECTKKTKRRVIFTCVPKEYKLDHHKTETWSYLDIAVAKVESPFDFDKELHKKLCSYAPTRIPINFDERYEQPGVDAMALGWGHPTKYIKAIHQYNSNLDYLNYASTQILDKETCLTYFSSNKPMEPVIKTSLICTLEAGNLNDKGELITTSKSLVEGCITLEQKRLGMPGTVCGIEEYGGGFSVEPNDDFIDKTKRQNSNKNTSHEKLRTDDYYMKKAAETPGICQNDHGGPLVTWIGTREVLIGVASLYNLDTDFKCMGPYLFTSTQYCSAFLKCILSMENGTDVKRRCNNPEKQPFQLIQRRISWPDHPDRPVGDEIIVKRPQVPMSAFNSGKR